MGPFAGVQTVVEEAALQGVELRVVVDREVLCCGEPCPPIELAGITPARVPLPSGRAEVAVQPPALGVLLEPAAQPRPFAQERLVRDLDLARADREQAAVGELG